MVQAAREDPDETEATNVPHFVRIALGDREFYEHLASVISRSFGPPGGREEVRGNREKEWDLQWRHRCKVIRNTPIGTIRLACTPSRQRACPYRAAAWLGRALSEAMLARRVLPRQLTVGDPG